MSDPTENPKPKPGTKEYNAMKKRESRARKEERERQRQQEEEARAEAERARAARKLELETQRKSLINKIYYQMNTKNRDASDPYVQDLELQLQAVREEESYLSDSNNLVIPMPGFAGGQYGAPASQVSTFAVANEAPNANFQTPMRAEGTLSQSALTRTGTPAPRANLFSANSLRDVHGREGSTTPSAALMTGTPTIRSADPLSSSSLHGVVPATPGGQIVPYGVAGTYHYGTPHYSVAGTGGDQLVRHGTAMDQTVPGSVASRRGVSPGPMARRYGPAPPAEDMDAYGAMCKLMEDSSPNSKKDLAQGILQHQKEKSEMAEKKEAFLGFLDSVDVSTVCLIHSPFTAFFPSLISSPFNALIRPNVDFRVARSTKAAH